MFVVFPELYTIDVKNISKYRKLHRKSHKQFCLPQGAEVLDVPRVSPYAKVLESAVPWCPPHGAGECEPHTSLGTVHIPLYSCFSVIGNPISTLLTSLLSPAFYYYCYYHCCYCYYFVWLILRQVLTM